MCWHSASHPDLVHPAFAYDRCMITERLGIGVHPRISHAAKRGQCRTTSTNAGRLSPHASRSRPRPYFLDRELARRFPMESTISPTTRLGQRRHRPRHRDFAVSASGGGRLDGPASLPHARTLLLTLTLEAATDCVALVEVALQRLADAFDLTLAVCHFPPGTSKWNKIEHRLSASSRRTGAGNHFSHQAIVNLIAATTTEPAYA